MLGNIFHNLGDYLKRNYFIFIVIYFYCYLFKIFVNYSDRTPIKSLRDLEILYNNDTNSFLSTFSTFFSSTTKSQDSTIILVMEGGQFVYPGIDLGFTRNLKAHEREVYYLYIFQNIYYNFYYY